MPIHLEVNLVEITTALEVFDDGVVVSEEGMTNDAVVVAKVSKGSALPSVHEKG